MELPADKERNEIEKKQEENRERVSMYYYRTFCTTEEGRFVLEDILSELRYWADELKDNDEVALYNAAKVILKKMGLTDNVSTLMDAMISVSKYTRKEM